MKKIRRWIADRWKRRQSGTVEKKAGAGSRGGVPSFSGTYTASVPAPNGVSFDEVRLDVDGWYPQQALSGRIESGAQSAHWVATLTPVGGFGNEWQATVGQVFGDLSLISPGASIHVMATGASALPIAVKLALTLQGQAPQELVRVSTYFRELDIETHVLNPVKPWARYTVDTCASPNRPSGLACETLDVPTVFRRAGFDTTMSIHDIPVSFGPCGTPPWPQLSLGTPSELHSLMEATWSKYTLKSQWAVWLGLVPSQFLYAAGMMFDGPKSGVKVPERQGAVVFPDVLIKYSSESQSEKLRNNFHTLVHEIGHCLNLAHSDSKNPTPKTPGGPLSTPWIPNLPDDEFTRSFMTTVSLYPYPPGPITYGDNVRWFWEGFEYRFSDAELMFLRHAPENYVIPGVTDWGTSHGRLSQPGDSIWLSVSQRRLAEGTVCADTHLPVGLVVEVGSDSEHPLQLRDALRFEMFVDKEWVEAPRTTTLSCAALTCGPGESVQVQLVCLIPKRHMRQEVQVRALFVDSNEIAVRSESTVLRAIDS